MKEIWKDVQGYEGYYQVSNLGNIKSLRKWNGREYVKTERVLKQFLSTTGYYKVKLAKNNQKQDAKVHRLVAMAFIPNDNNKPFINHIDGNKLNNNVSNLEWCTPSENMKHAYATGLAPSVTIEESLLKRMYIEEGKNAYEIARALQTNVQAVYRNLRANGIRIRSTSECKDVYHIPLDELLQDFKRGEKNRKLAKKYNCSATIIATRKYQFKKRGLLC